MDEQRKQFEEWAEWNIAQPSKSGYHGTLGEWRYNQPFMNMCWNCWKDAQKVLDNENSE